ncbi:hypothetical protein [Anabaena sp. CCY 0017]|uniref:hypothetical protein n=1 Tax=Anabaena sp. CCY 0017 TaxID=3103866 RepID=UPI0039C711EF
MKINPDGTIDLEPGKDVFTIGQQAQYKGANRWHRVRKFSSQLADAASSDGKGLFGRVLGGLKRLGGFALSVANALGIQISWSSLWQFLQMTSYTVYNFDWNQSDAQIKQQIESTNNLISNMAGYILGDSTIRVATVAVVNGVPIKYPIIPARVAVDIAKERVAALRQDVTAESRTNIENQFKFGITLIGQLGLQNLFNQSILSLRSLRMFGLSPVAQPGEAWSFAKKVDEKIQSIKPEILREFVKGYLGGVENAFWDSGYIVTMGLDDIWRMEQFKNEIELGENKSVRINPEP